MIGLGVFDFIIKNQVDPQTGEVYRAFKCCNDDTMAERCRIKDANDCLYSVKATNTFNSEICVLLRNGFINGKITLPVNEVNGEEYLKQTIKGWSKLKSQDQAMYKMSYVQSSLMVNELINLDHEVKNGNIKIMEKSGMRKDRYSSLAYNYWCLNQIVRKNKPKNQNSNIADLLASQTRRAKKVGMFS